MLSDLRYSPLIAIAASRHKFRLSLPRYDRIAGKRPRSTRHVAMGGANRVGEVVKCDRANGFALLLDVLGHWIGSDHACTPCQAVDATHCHHVFAYAGVGDFGVSFSWRRVHVRTMM